MRYLIIVFSAICIVIFTSCGSDETAPEITTGTVSGIVNFVGQPPEGVIQVEVSIFSQLDEKGRPTGPPDHYSEYFKQFTGKVPYKITGVSFGTYKLAAVGYKSPDWEPGTPQIILGMYGFSPPDDMVPDSFTVSKENPEVTGIDIVADYSLIKR